MRTIRNVVKALVLRERKLLVVEKRDHRGSRFLLPGGGQHPRESLAEALHRECLEEIGAMVTIGDLAYVRDYRSWNHSAADPDDDFQVVEFIFKCSIPSDYVPGFGVGPDSTQVSTRWLRLEELSAVAFVPQTLATVLLAAPGSAVYLGDVN